MYLLNHLFCVRKLDYICFLETCWNIGKHLCAATWTAAAAVSMSLGYIGFCYSHDPVILAARICCWDPENASNRPCKRGLISMKHSLKILFGTKYKRKTSWHISIFGELIMCRLYVFAHWKLHRVKHLIFTIELRIKLFCTKALYKLRS